MRYHVTAVIRETTVDRIGGTVEVLREVEVSIPITESQAAADQYVVRCRDAVINAIPTSIVLQK